VEGRTAIDTHAIRACLERLADQRSGQRKKARSARGDHKIYRIKVRSAQGTTETLNVLLDIGPKRQPEPVLERIADQFRVPRDQLDEVVARWSKEDFLAHCAELDADDLKPPSMRIGAPGAAPPRRGR
jgi:hypothetical protein